VSSSWLPVKSHDGDQQGKGADLNYVTVHPSHREPPNAAKAPLEASSQRLLSKPLEAKLKDLEAKLKDLEAKLKDLEIERATLEQELQKLKQELKDKDYYLLFAGTNLNVIPNFK
jgi:chromosome segregation ATPase